MENKEHNSYYYEGLKLAKSILKDKSEDDVSRLLLKLAKEVNLRALKSLEMLLFSNGTANDIRFDINYLSKRRLNDKTGESIALNLSISQLADAYRILWNFVRAYNVDCNQKDKNNNTFYGNLADTCANQLNKDHLFFDRPDIVNYAFPIIRDLYKENRINPKQPCYGDFPLFDILTDNFANYKSEWSEMVRDLINRYRTENNLIIRLTENQIIGSGSYGPKLFATYTPETVFSLLYPNQAAIEGPILDGKVTSWCFKSGDTFHSFTNEDFHYIDTEVRRLVKK